MGEAGPSHPDGSFWSDSLGQLYPTELSVMLEIFYTHIVLLRSSENNADEPHEAGAVEDLIFSILFN